MKLQVKEIDGRRFYYSDFGSENHGRTSFRLWVHHSLKKLDEEGKPYIEFPLKGSLTQGKSPYTVILRPGDNLIYDVFVRCGYRGEGWVEEFNPQPIKNFEYAIYSSPRGNLGISYGYLVEVAGENSLSYKWKKTGRLYGKPSSGVTIITPEGETQELEETDLCEIEELAE